MKDPETEVERIMSMTDEEIIAECRARGDDPEKIAERLRGVVRRTIDLARVQRMGNDKAEWRQHNWAKSPHPERATDYELFEELALPNGGVIARIEQFKSSSHCFYATTPNDRSGCLGSHDYARQWCETKTGNKLN